MQQLALRPPSFPTRRSYRTNMTAEIVSHLVEKFPDATPAECQRFFEAYRRRHHAKDVQAEAENALQDYVAWRKQFRMDGNGGTSLSINGSENVDPGDHDAMLWRKACGRCESSLKKSQPVASKTKTSSVSRRKMQQKSRDATSKPAIMAPQFVFMHNINHSAIVDKKGNSILHVLPAMIDIQKFTAEYYGQTLLFYLDALLNRNSYDRMTVLLDVRPGQGWPNPLAVFMVNFIRKVVTMVQGRFPGRLERLIVFPVPKPAMGIFQAVQWAFHAELVEKIVLVSGSAERKSPLPRRDLHQYIDKDMLELTEKVRLEMFLPE
jgi:CRAL/TRIO domain